MDRERDKARDARLVEAGLGGDRAALEQLVEHYYRPIYNAAFRILNDMDASADVAQATFLSAFENLPSYNPDYKFFSWIYRIAVNQALDHGRKRQMAEEKVHLEVVQTLEESPEHDLDEKEAGSMVRRLLTHMQEDYRAVLVLRHYSELSYEEMAEVLDIPVKTVKSRLYSARQVLKSSLQENGFEI